MSGPISLIIIIVHYIRGAYTLCSNYRRLMRFKKILVHFYININDYFIIYCLQVPYVVIPPLLMNYVC